MSGNRKKPGPRPRVDAAAKVAMLAAVREGRRLDVVAASYGVTLQAFYSARRRDPVFAVAWRDAHSLSAEAERRPAFSLDEDSDFIAPNNRRPLQRRKMRHVRFDERRKADFLVHFARSCDLKAAAAAAGVCERTVFNHLRVDRAFAESFEEALKLAMVRLEGIAARRCLEAQARLRAAVDAAEDEKIQEEEDVAFERAMRLLARRDRIRGCPGSWEMRSAR